MLPLEQLEALADALLDFQGPADLAAWLAACGGCPSERPHRRVSHREPGGSGVRDYIHVMELAEGHRANPCGYAIDEE